MIRCTTNSVLNSYRSNLTMSKIKLNSSMNTVLSQRNFNSYADDPSAASQSFQLRRSYARTSSQESVTSTVVSQYETMSSALMNVVDDVNAQSDSSAFAAVLEGISDTTGSGRKPLGQTLIQLSENIVHTMNSKYGDAFLFAGADGLNVPFSWDTNDDGERTLCYRGVSVDCDPNSTDETELRNYKTLETLAGETRYVDIGLGLQEDAAGNLITSSAYNVSHPGIKYLGYGVDEDGDPKNIASIINRMGELLNHCDDDGQWASFDDRNEFQRLAQKFEDAAADLTEMHIEQDTDAGYLKDHLKQLQDTAYTLNEQIMDLEQVDLADAITSYSWAQYCYNAALKMGNSILSESLMDYLQ